MKDMLEDLVPSTYMRSLFAEEEFQFSDSQKATLIWNAPTISWNEKIDLLKELEKETDDINLSFQIKRRVKYEEEVYSRFMQNPDDKCIYVITEEHSFGSYNLGFFKEYNMARAYALEYMRAYKVLCTIEKQLIVRDSSDLKEYDGKGIFKEAINQDGSVRYISSGEMMLDVHSSSNSFESQFINFPFVGNIGWPVRDLTDEYDDDSFMAYGVLMCDTKKWEEYTRCITESDNNCVDYSDVQVEVYFLNKQGVWVHEHVNPLFLEVGEYPRNCEDEKGKAYVLAMEAFCDYWTNRFREDDDVAFAKRAIDAARNYRDVCLKSYVDNEKKRNRLVDWAKTIHDIMF